MRRHVESLSDWLVVGLAPTLVGFLLASLVCFLVEVLYQGEFNARLQFVFCMFVMGSVCIARISMEEGTAYAALFAAPLAGATGLALMAFVQFTGPLAPISFLLNFAMMGGIWYCSHQLTKDSTLLESQPDETGAGLLTQLGWEGRAGDVNSPRESPDTFEAVSEDPNAAPKPEPTWLEKFVRGNGPHSPGAWAFYFSLAAIPVFGMGQFFLPTDLESRRWVFKLLVIYITSALGLLLATSFLGVRRYLNQRRLDLPLDMAAAWLAVGSVMIVGLLCVAFILPRPLPEYSIVHMLPEIKSAPRDPSPVSVGEEGTKKGEPGQGKGESEKEGDGKSKGKGKPDDQSKSGEQKNGTQGDDSSSQGQKSGDQGEQKGGEQKGGEQNGDKSGEKKGEEQKGGEQKNNDTKSPQQSGQEKENSTPGPPKTGNEPQPKSSEQVKQSPPPSHATPSGPSLLQRLFQSLPDIFNYLGFALIFAIVGYFAYHNREFLLAAWQRLKQELAELWEKLFGRKPSPETAVETAAPPPLPPAFASFSDPFASGQAGKWTLAELVRYSFKALEAWGREHGNVRTEEQTPGEYAQSVATAQPTVATEVQQLAALYGQVAYGPGAATQPAAEIVRRFWQRLRPSPA